jgi:hypothetical protein
VVDPNTSNLELSIISWPSAPMQPVPLQSSDIWDTLLKTLNKFK